MAAAVAQMAQPVSAPITLIESRSQGFL